jgi:hypothetical protein
VVALGVPVALIPLTGKPVQFDKFPDEGVPNAGVTNVGDVVPAKAPVPLSPESPFPTLLIVAIYVPLIMTL